tara:strand:- start:496 stop:732 length:237 start_codon:yes stop_codon:yes gene_type:complete
MDLLKGWTPENKHLMLRKMQRLGIHNGGFFGTIEKNVALYNQLVREVPPVNIYTHEEYDMGEAMQILRDARTNDNKGT